MSLRKGFKVIDSCSIKHSRPHPKHPSNGIPFAAPPIGKLRFEKPQPPIPWTKPINATAYSKGCIPCTSAGVSRDTVSEDCLYLNVWSPNLQGLLPVFLFIHGGAYETGAASVYDAKAFRENFARRGIVVVTIQYRLGQFGFLTLNDSVITPNLGLWDQTLGLQWIQDNIGKFGGDSKRVTIMGESAGSESVSQLTISPKTQHLFQQAIQMSGTSIGAAARGTNTLTFSANWTSRLGCDLKSDYKTCLQGKTVEEFWKVKENNAWGCGPDDLNWLGFAPIIDEDFFPKPEDALKTVPKYPTIFGLNQVEGRLFSLEGASIYMSFGLGPLKWPKYNESQFVDFVKKFITFKGYTSEERDQATQDILSYYERGHDPSDAKYWVERYVESYSDWGMNVPVVREAIAKTQAGSPVYAFLMDYDNPTTWPAGAPAPGSTHSSEFPYTFGMLADFNYTQDDLTVEKYIQDALVQFIKTGNPSTTAMSWAPFSLENHDFLSLKPKPEMKTDWFGDSYRFWTDYMKKYKYDWITYGPW
ncbi:unnamed protein product, partial [Mesorhabditis belari]|uniref:Carboxylic ester hydrolase n=1 Tax=Mesorhabditis belari TaxID=2138241 RepID=A0AAF3F7M7_9BILA